jgi:carbamoyltransferase
MIVLGLNGGVSMPYENVPIFNTGNSHDSSAALLIDGEIVGAIEEERLNRIKHTNKFPLNAIREVLGERNLTLEQVDFFSYYATEEFITSTFKEFYYIDPYYNKAFWARKVIDQLFKQALNFEIDENKICFVDHHLSHAASAFYMSGFKESLILTLDGSGERISGRILYGDKNGMKSIDHISEMNSLGHYYVIVSQFLGYCVYDEYKVMGLAPYGNPAKYRDIFSLFYRLLPQGRFEMHRERIYPLLFEIATPRRKGQEFTQVHKDVAAALQESIETIILHIVKYYSTTFGYKNLCLGGGVAHNCSANGKILYSGLFKNIFVQPAAHDAGNSIGAAAYTYLEKCPKKEIRKLEHVFIGTPVKEDPELFGILKGWESFITFKKEENIEKAAADLIGKGKIIGWVQGKAEFGPRALGNRSIVADPRPHANRDLINRMVKKREGYRPFAPSVLEERAGDYFDIGMNGTSFDYMTFVVKVKKECQATLGAITHVDGTARVQTVSKLQNQRYWNLINEFGKLSGMPMLLNTSFNNNVEPIVNTAEDAITCFLTTGLDHLVIGDYLIDKKGGDHTESLEQLVPKIPPYVFIQSQRSYDSLESESIKYEIGFNYSVHNHPISREVFELISRADGKSSLKELLRLNSPSCDERRSILQEIDGLWGLRYIVLQINNM